MNVAISVVASSVKVEYEYLLANRNRLIEWLRRGRKDLARDRFER
jgi:hypothetical protein